MECVSIELKIEGIIFYLLFEITKQSEKSFTITRYTLDQDQQADLLADFLPYRAQIVRVEKFGQVFNKLSDEVLIDPRVHTEEGKELCQLLYREIVKELAKVPPPPPKKLWWQKKD